jgi:hypothetical protein
MFELFQFGADRFLSRRNGDSQFVLRSVEFTVGGIKAGFSDLEGSRLPAASAATPWACHALR